MRIMKSLCRTSVAAAVALAGLSVAVPAGASAATCQSWGTQPSTAANGTHQLIGVTTTSPCNAWAVGIYYVQPAENTLIEHWNGTKWTLQFSPNPDSTANYLGGVSATSASNAWAVGNIGLSPHRVLIEHWNGTT